MSRESMHNKFIKEVERLGLDISQKDFAEKMQVKEPIISMYLNGKRNVSIGFLKRFCELYGLNYDEMTREGDPPVKLSDKELIAMFMTVSRAQTAILDRIEEKMAKEQTLAIFEANYLKRTLAASLVVAKGQEDAMKEIRSLFSQLGAQRKTPLKGAGKARGRKNGGFEKKGNRPA